MMRCIDTKEVSRNVHQGFLARGLKPSNVHLSMCVYHFHHILKRAHDIYSFDRLCAKYKLSQGSVLGTVAQIRPVCGLGMIGDWGGGWWKVCFSDMGDPVSKSNSGSTTWEL